MLRLRERVRACGPSCFAQHDRTNNPEKNNSTGGSYRTLSWPFLFQQSWAILDLEPLHVTSLQTVPPANDEATSDRWAGCVSVIVPVYNELAHLEDLLRAVLASPVKKEV